MTYVDSLSALSDPTRRKVFEIVAKGPYSVTDLAQVLPVSRPAVSQHLKVLSDAGLVQVQAQGTRRIYTLRAEGLRDLRAYLDQFWDAALVGFANEVQRLEGQGNDGPDYQDN